MLHVDGCGEYHAGDTDLGGIYENITNILHTGGQERTLCSSLQIRGEKGNGCKFPRNTESREKENIGKRLKHRARAKRNNSWENIPHVSHEK